MTLDTGAHGDTKSTCPASEDRKNPVPCGEGLRPNGGHSPYFAFGDDTYRHGRTTRTDPHGPSRTLTDLTDLTDTHGPSRTLTDTHGTHGLSRTLTDSHGLSWISRISRILTHSRVTDSHGRTDLTDLTDSHRSDGSDGCHLKSCSDTQMCQLPP